MTVTATTDTVTVVINGVTTEIALEDTTALITALFTARKAGYEARRAGKAEIAAARKAETAKKKAERVAAAKVKKAEQLKKLEAKIAELKKAAAAAAA